MENQLKEQINFSELRIIEKAFHLNDQLHDLILKKSGEIFSIIIQGTQGKIHFHEQEIAEQLGIHDPKLDHLVEYIFILYNLGLQPQRTRDFQLKLLVEGCPTLFLKKSNYVMTV